MKVLGNIIWHFPFCGWVLALFVTMMGLLFTVTVVFAPTGTGLLQVAKLLWWPFGNALVSQKDFEKYASEGSAVG